MTIPGVSYGQTGPWALAVWVKFETVPGSLVSYVLSQNNSGNASPTLSPDTVRGGAVRCRGLEERKEGGDTGGGGKEEDTVGDSGVVEKASRRGPCQVSSGRGCLS